MPEACRGLSSRPCRKPAAGAHTRGSNRAFLFPRTQRAVRHALKGTLGQWLDWLDSHKHHKRLMSAAGRKAATNRLRVGFAQLQGPAQRRARQAALDRLVRQYVAWQRVSRLRHGTGWWWAWRSRRVANAFRAKHAYASAWAMWHEHVRRVVSEKVPTTGSNGPTRRALATACFCL